MLAAVTDVALKGWWLCCRFTLQLDHIKLALCHGREPFVGITVAGVLLDNIRDTDHSGQLSPDCSLYTP